MVAGGLMFDPGITIAIQNISPALPFLFSQGEFLDSTPWYLLLVSIVFLGFHPRYGIRLAVLFGLTGGINEAMKLAWHLPRPYWVSPAVEVFSHHSSFGFPSGAAMYGAVIYGYIASVVQRWWAALACALLLVSTCLVRVFAGIHFVMDIFGGLVSGFLLLLIFFPAEPRIGRFAGSLSRSGRWAGIIVLSAIPLLFVVPAYLSLGGWQVPASWIATAFQQTGTEINPVSIQYAWGAAGIILGSLAGYEVLLSRGGWTPPSDPSQKTMVVLTGTVSVLLLNGLLLAIRSIPDLPVPIDQGARVLSMAIVLFWLTCCVPLIARRAGFA